MIDDFLDNLKFGNHKIAEKIGRAILNKSTNIEFWDKHIIEAFLKDSNKNIRFNSTKPGLTFFPVLLNGNNSVYAAIVGIQCYEKDSSTDGSDNNSLKSLFTPFISSISSLLDKLLKIKDERRIVFDWNLSKLEFKYTVPEYNSKPKNYNEVLSSMIGRSHILALLLSAISYRLNFSISPEYVFSGGVNQNDLAIEAQDEEYLIQKREIVCSEIPEGKLIANCIENPYDYPFLCSFIKYQGLEMLLRKFLNDININIDKIEKLPNTKYDITKCLYKETQLDNNWNEAVLIKFIDWTHDYNFNSKFIEFLKSNKSDFNQNKVVIVSGLKVSYLGPLLVSSNELLNHTKKALALHHGHYNHDTQENPEDCEDCYTAIVILRNRTSALQRGNLIIYKKLPDVNEF